MENPTQTPPFPEQVLYLYSKDYKDVQQDNEKKYFAKIIKGLDLLPIDNKFFKTIQSLIKFFKFSFLLLLKKPFDKILNDPQLLQQREGDMKKIAKIGHDLIGGGTHIHQLDFLFVKGIDHNFYKQIKIKQDKRKFIDYIKKLSENKKRLYDRISEKIITEDDIMQFASQNSGKDLKYLDDLLENQIKMSLKDIQVKFNEIKIERKKFAKRTVQQDRQQQVRSPTKETPTPKQQEQTTPAKPKKQDDNLQDIMVCCRRSFYHKQIIYQPQSINFVYRHYLDYFRQEHHFDILKTICGLLNSQGGFLFIGIREDKNTYKKEVEGYTIIEKDKVDFKNRIEDLVDKCIQPTISHDILRIQFVPLKSYQSNKFISGKFLIKICVRFGQRRQFYSFKEFSDSKKQYFAVRTDNDTKIITSSQDILGIYKTRVTETPSDPLPVHKELCPKPQVGRPLYQIEELSNKR